MIINIYDFDKTIYAGDSSVDFWLFCLRSDWTLFRFLPAQVFGLIKFLIGISDKLSFKQTYFSFLSDVADVNKAVNEFWKSRSSKIKSWYLATDRRDDVIISASPEFLLAPIIKQLGCKKLIASVVDSSTGYFVSKNCYGAEKVTRFKAEFKQSPQVEKAYSDSLSDLPILKLAKEAFIVSGDKIVDLSGYKEGIVKRIFLKKEFIKFLFVGTLNALFGILLSSAYSLLTDKALLAFVLGFSTSLIPSYFLNTIITFNSRKFGLRLFAKFCVSYVPNFLVQLFNIYVLDRIFAWPKLLLFTVSIVISTPVTFVLLSLFAFNNKTSKKGKK